MGRPTRKRFTLLTAAALAAAASGLSVSPPWLQQTVRAAVLDVVVSGQAAILGRYDAWRASSALSAISRPPAHCVTGESGSATNPLADRVRTLEQTCRRLRIETARLREELELAEKYGVSPIPLSAAQRTSAAEMRTSVPSAARASGTADTRDSVPTVVWASVVSRQTLSQWRSVRPLNRGRTAGIAESSLVLDEGLPHLDQGRDAGVEPELDVFIGRCVVGRIASVGRWTSTLESITDPRYRALVQIVRPTDQGGSFGTEGILVGQGNGLCKLTDVPTTETVRAGDEVYTSDRDGRTGVPLYYGRIRSVEEAGRQWAITVEPAVNVERLKSVAILKLPPGFARTLAE